MSSTPLELALSRINAGEFNFTFESNDKPLRDMNVLERQKAHETRQRMNEKQAEMKKNVRTMLAELFEVTKHKNEPKLWELAWEHGHSSGYSEVAIHYSDFVQLLK